MLTKHYTFWQRLLRSHAWRLPATAMGFGLFAAGAGGLSIGVFPLIYLMPIKQQRKQNLTRRSIATFFRFYLRLLRGMRLLSYEFDQVTQLSIPGQLIIVNHPSLLDVVFIIAFAGGANCIVKGSLWRNPVLAIAVRAAGYIRNDSSDLIQRCVTNLQQGNSLIIFPEGTRTKPGQPLRFLRGPANIALSAGKAITPVVINCHPATLLKHQKWYEISATPPHYTIRVMPEFSLAPYLAEGQLQRAAARQLTRDLTAYFTEQIAVIERTIV